MEQEINAVRDVYGSFTLIVEDHNLDHLYSSILAQIKKRKSCELSAGLLEKLSAMSLLSALRILMITEMA